ncbi:hypothetical protein B5X24_HaOG208203 [Helicoverpa armigera]|uniref:Uncharacterized protein n=1 Tax=Helicoverpa armigera TaxID=29058 RepID=A0A2W1BH81_HELAM|nr:hypothetical protein B5X24_HaOG208203 [Helicoverpa armigera]
MIELHVKRIVRATFLVSHGCHFKQQIIDELPENYGQNTKNYEITVTRKFIIFNSLKFPIFCSKDHENEAASKK